MGFPDDFRFSGTKVEIAKQIGNAVPPPLAGAVAQHVRALMDEWLNSTLTVPLIMANVAERDKIVSGI